MKDLKIIIGDFPTDLNVNIEVTVEIDGKQFDCRILAEYAVSERYGSNWILVGLTGLVHEALPDGYDQSEVERMIEEQAKGVVPETFIFD